MSDLWPELLRITLYPDQVILERGKLVVSLAGVEPRYFEPEIVPVEPRHEPALWAAPLAVLRIILDGLPERPHDASVILSNHFVHYPFVNGANASEPDRAADLIEESLQLALSESLQQHQCRLASLQPRIVTLGEDVADELQGEPGWLVAVEQGLASIGLVQDGEFIHFRNMHMWPASSVELLSVLDREAFGAGLKNLPRNLILWTRDEFDEVVMPLKSGWQITRLGEQPTTAAPRREAIRQVSLAGARA